MAEQRREMPHSQALLFWVIDRVTLQTTPGSPSRSRGTTIISICRHTSLKERSDIEIQRRKRLPSTASARRNHSRFRRRRNATTTATRAATRPKSSANLSRFDTLQGPKPPSWRQTVATQRCHRSSQPQQRMRGGGRLWLVPGCTIGGAA